MLVSLNPKELKMNKCALVRASIALLALSIFSANIQAADPPGAGDKNGTGGGAAPKDGNDWTGDQVQIRGKLTDLKSIVSSDESSYIAPPFTRFDVSHDTGTNITLIPRNNFETNKTGKRIKVTPSKTHQLYNALNFTQPSTLEVDITDSEQVVEPYTAYTVSKSAFEHVPFTKYGFAYGALVVPFKYQGKSSELNNSTSYQIYVQYQRSSNGLAEGPFISGGISTADVATGVGTSTPKNGLSYGLGWIFDLKKGSGFQLAVMLGQDRFGSGSGYQYEGETWYSFSIGYNLGSSTTNGTK
jgi:hypothetical protein